RISEGGVDKGIVCIDVPAVLLVCQAGFDPLAQRVAGVRKGFMSRDGAGDGKDIVGAERVEGTHGPIQLSSADVEAPTQAGLKGVRHHLLKIRISNKGVVDQTGSEGIGTG